MAFEASVLRRSAATLGAFLEPDQNVGVFWSAVEKSLIETEVLAVEIRQFVGQDLRTLVPRVISRTEGAVAIKERWPGRQWDEAQAARPAGATRG